VVNLGGTTLFDNAAGGTLRKSAGTGTLTINIPFANAGDARCQAGTMSFSSGYTQSAGSISVEGGTISSVTPLNIQGGLVGGFGTFATAITNAGSLAPGLSPGAVAITGTYTQTAAGAFDVEIGGVAPGSDHDQANLSDAAALSGSLNVSLVNGFMPADLDTFTIMTFGSSSGAFSAVNLPDLPGDLRWKIHHNPTSFVLEVLADLDGDGVRNMDDCAPSDPTAWSVPAEVAGVAFASDAQTVLWASLAAQAGPSTIYDALRGLIAELPVGGASETCLASGTTATQATDASTPAPGAGFYYLVRGRNVCGVGHYGTTSSGAPRTSSACP
jgi:hypothetical protein